MVGFSKHSIERKVLIGVANHGDLWYMLRENCSALYLNIIQISASALNRPVAKCIPISTRSCFTLSRASSYTNKEI